MAIAVFLQPPGNGQEDIDADRAGKAKERAQEKLAKGGLSDKEYKIVEAKLQRALVRLSVKS